jgi:glucokinase
MQGWSDVPLASLLQETLSRPVKLVNDADAALLAECWVGASSTLTRQNKTVVMMTLGSGVGAAAYCNGSLVVGARGLIEAGHSIVDSSPTARLCGCGQRGCIEAYASANSVRNRFQESNATAGGEGGSENQVISTAQLFELAASSGESQQVELAKSVIEETARLIAVFCINICRFYDPDVIIIG